MIKRLLSIAAIFALATVANAGPSDPRTMPTLEEAQLVGTATLTAVHGIPSLHEPVDVFVNEEYAFSFDFAQSVGPVPLEAGPTLVEVKLGNLTLLSERIWLLANRSYAVGAHLTDTGAIAMDFYKNDLSPLRRGTSRLVIRHNAKAAPVEVRIAESGAKGWQLSIPSVGNRNQAGPFDLEAGSYTIAMFVGGIEVYRVEDVPLLEGFATSAYAIGIFPYSFQLLTLRDKTE